VRKIFILGSTGSIGTAALDVIKNFPDKFKVKGLSAGSNYLLLAEQCRRFNPEIICINCPKGLKYLQEEFPQKKIFFGPKGLEKALKACSYDLAVNALVGSAGVMPTVAILRQGADVALANKETLVTAGHVIMNLAARKNASIIPVDSEHSAIFHILRGINRKEIHRLILTASGGPFYNKPEIGEPAISDVLSHPTWKMGKKITVDSATMMNKGFELIEAHFLFQIPYDKIDVVIHPQSIIHSMVESIDGEIYAQLGNTDMRHPVQNALTFPRLKPTILPRLNLTSIRELTFAEPDEKKFPLLKTARNCGLAGGSVLTALNAANEAAVSAFLAGKIRFRAIAEIVDQTVQKHNNRTKPGLEEIIEIDSQIKKQILSNLD